jgi:hypothetical protein
MRAGVFSIWSVLLALFASVVVLVPGCSGGPYDLTIRSTPGGSVTTPGEGTFTYDAGTVVNLVATPDGGYHFAWWFVWDMEPIADSDDATTTITMNGDWWITAGFALEVRDWYDLHAISTNLSGWYILMNDLDSTTVGYEELASATANEGKGWQPIGRRHAEFRGYLFGQGYKISDLFINRPDEERVGLFGHVGGANILDIGIVNANVTGNSSVGGLVGSSYGNVRRSYSTGSVTGSGGVGGLVGWNNGYVDRSYSTASVTGSKGVGGLVGHNLGHVQDSHVLNSYSSGNVTGNFTVGGLVGWNWDASVSNSYSTGSVTGTCNVTGNSTFGGLVGWNVGGPVDNSFWDTESSGKPASDGGTGKTTAEMKDIATFSGVTWDIVAVENSDTRSPTYTWNIVNEVTYPFLSWE